jgi:superfamily I DNA/RNA helicase
MASVINAVDVGGLSYHLDTTDSVGLALGIVAPLAEGIGGVGEPTYFREVLQRVGVNDLIATASSGIGDKLARQRNVLGLTGDAERLLGELDLPPNEVVARLQGRGAVQILSTHGAKGTEFPIVCFVGLEDDVLPDYRSHSSPHRMAEERRVFYVGLTRAMRWAHLSYVNKRTSGYGSRACKPSRFVRQIPDGLYTRQDEMAGSGA